MRLCFQEVQKAGKSVQNGEQQGGCLQTLNTQTPQPPAAAHRRQYVLWGDVSGERCP